MANKTGELPGKAGVKSLAKKLENSRHGFEPHPGAGKTAGAFGKEDPRGVARAEAEELERESKAGTEASEEDE